MPEFPNSPTTDKLKSTDKLKPEHIKVFRYVKILRGCVVVYLVKSVPKNCNVLWFQFIGGYQFISGWRIQGIPWIWDFQEFRIPAFKNPRKSKIPRQYTEPGYKVVAHVYTQGCETSILQIRDMLQQITST